MAEREGFESAYKRKFNNMQGHGWHKRTSRAAVNRLTDRGRIARRPSLVSVLAISEGKQLPYVRIRPYGQLLAGSPIFVFGSIQPLTLRFRVNVKHVLPAP